MKRQIICGACRAGQAGKQYKYDGEWFINVEGIWKKQHHIRMYGCDYCGAPIYIGYTAHCQSLGLDFQPYHRWEEEYMTIKEVTILNGPVPGENPCNR
jgi:hypothetical protein